MNAQELFLDVSSGRFLDGESNIPTSKPIVYSNEERSVVINVLQVKKNVVDKRQPSANSKYKARLGTASNLLANGLPASTAPIETIRATATLVTAPSQQAKATGIIYSYTGVTASVSASITTFPVVTGIFNATIFSQASVTATITASIATPVPSIITKGLLVDTPKISDSFLINSQFIQSPLSLATQLNSPVTATFTAEIFDNKLAKVNIVTKGVGYPDGSYSLSISSPNPTAATFSATVVSGVVTTISIVTGGSGYGAGPFNLVFGSTTGTIAAATASSLNGSINQITITDGGTNYTSAPNVTLATPSSLTAIAQVVAIGGRIQSIVITSGGLGYTNAPTVTLFRPAKAIERAGKTFIYLGVKGQNTNEVNLIFPNPDDLSTPAQESKPSGTIKWVSEGNWELNITSTGYGYTSQVDLSFDPIFVYLPISSYGSLSPLGGLVSSTKEAGGGRVRGCSQPIVTEFQTELTQYSPGALRFNKTNPLLLQWICGSSRINDFNARLFQSLQGDLTATPNGIINSNNSCSKTLNSRFFYSTISQDLDGIGGVAPGSSLDTEKFYDPTFRNNANDLSIKSIGFDSGRSEAFDETWFPKTNLIKYLSSPSQLLPEQNKALLPIRQTTNIPSTVNIVFHSIGLEPSKRSESNPASIGPNHQKYVGKKARCAIVPSNRSFEPTSYAVVEIECPQTTQELVITAYSDNSEIGWKTYQYQPATIGKFFSFSYANGGRYTPIVRVLDAGAGYLSTYTGSYDLVELGSIRSGDVLFETPSQVEYIFPKSVTQGFLKSALSRDISVSTAQGGFATEYFLDYGGFGFTGESVNIGFKSVSTAAQVQGVSLTNIPKNYADGIYPCQVSTPPGGGTVAEIDLIVSRGISSVAVRFGGLGYTSAPIVTAVPPNLIGGQVVGVTVLTAPRGYSINQPFYLSIPTSPVANGNAVVFFTIDDSGFITTNIENAGFGYASTDLVCTAPDPDLRLQNGFIQNLSLSNSPVGYVIGKSYDLNIQKSPQSGGTALAKLVRKNVSRYEIQISYAGAGYTSAPIVTAPPFDDINNYVYAVTASDFGRGYAPGTYDATVTTAPIGGQTAKAVFVKEESGNSYFNMQDSGFGYLSAPQISVPTPAGNIISLISITCAGSFYADNNIETQITDAQGSGVELERPDIQAGAVAGIGIIKSGYGYSNFPKIQFNKPSAPVLTRVAPNQFAVDFNITTASANAILSTATQKDILMEVYETDGTNEQVVAQATVSLAKRVLE